MNVQQSINIKGIPKFRSFRSSEIKERQAISISHRELYPSTDE